MVLFLPLAKKKLLLKILANFFLPFPSLPKITIWQHLRKCKKFGRAKLTKPKGKLKLCLQNKIMALPNFDKLKGAQCAREGCFGTAGYVPVLRLYAPNAPAGCFAEMAFAIPLCGGCAGETKLEHLLNEKDWLLIDSTIERGGAPKPDRARTEITWLPLFNIALPATDLPPEFIN